MHPSSHGVHRGGELSDGCRPGLLHDVLAQAELAGVALADSEELPPASRVTERQQLQPLGRPLRLLLGLGRPANSLGSGQHWSCGRLLSLSSCCSKNQTRSNKTWVWFAKVNGFTWSCGKYNGFLQNWEKIQIER